MDLYLFGYLFSSLDSAAQKSKHVCGRALSLAGPFQPYDVQAETC